MLRRLTTSKTTLVAILRGVQFIDAFDVASMAPALPRIATSLHMSPTALQWVVTA